MTELFEQERQFANRLNDYLSPSSPVRSREFLRGRDLVLTDIRRALGATGRSVFVYGDRGVGKTSLGQTAAYEFNPSASDPVIVSCDESSDFYSIMTDIANDVIGAEPGVLESKAASGLKFGIKGFGAEVVKEIQKSGRIPKPSSINEVVNIIDFLFGDSSVPHVALIDEFERISDDGDRRLFADFLKQVGDRELSLKFIICGVGKALDELLEAHHSCFRYLESIKLQRLEWSARLDIIAEAAIAVGIDVDRDTQIRIAAISDGFPYYIHLICQKMFWAAFDSDSAVVNYGHYNQAIDRAVESIEPELDRTYKKAIRKYNSDYEEVLWAAADHSDLERRSTDIWASYKRIAEELPESNLDRKKFNARLNALKQPSHGEMLVGTRQGWYTFRENVLRGYVRLRAARANVRLDIDHPRDPHYEASMVRGK